ncbi:ATP-binding protein [Dyella humi]|uniref:ATP-binding protein n=1 Tax=Dyella humi TaxID=1770547 RepID=A0ABW8IL12_9GAMM
MLEALRGVGYSVEAALADIIDNSISAHATEVRVEFDWDEEHSRISVLDDGCGMSDRELERAMQLGAKSPLDARDASDLGRFGMGLKTASFSHCRRLTVATVKEKVSSCLRWDLDELGRSEESGWLIFEGPSDGSEAFIGSLAEHTHGTLVLWEALDRIVTPGYKSSDFSDLIDRVEAHLAMVFHRLLDGARPRLKIFLNGNPIAPWDPFMMGHPAKPWVSPVAKLTTTGGQIEVQCHVLPHKDKLTEREMEHAAGVAGWTSQQGFYVYRNERLLVAGGWLGLGQRRAWNREEAHRLARIRLDITNTADAEWKIDIRKATARPPTSLRGWLTKLAEETRDRARKVYASRGGPINRSGGQPIEQAWRADHTKTGVRYRIDDHHPAIAAVLETCGENLALVKAMLRVIEETVPIQKIWLDTAEGKEASRIGFASEPPDAVLEVLDTLFLDLTGRRGLSDETARRMLLTMDPFQNYPGLVNAMSSDAP